MAYAPSMALLLEAWEAALSEAPVRRPLAALSVLTGRERKELEAFTIGERDALILRVRADLFGQQIVALTTCTSCGVDAELSFQVRDIIQAPVIRREVAVPVGERLLKTRLLTAGELETAAGASNVREALFHMCLVEPVDMEVTDELIAEVGKCLSVADPQANIELTIVCPSCSANALRRFDPWAFLWEELKAWSHKSLGQVHLLAHAYGWSEAEIVSLSPNRRIHYLRLLRA